MQHFNDAFKFKMEWAYPIDIRMATRGERTGNHESWSGIKLCRVRCDSGPGNNKFPQSTKLTDELRTRNSACIELMCVFEFHRAWRFFTFGLVLYFCKLPVFSLNHRLSAF